MAQLIDGKAIAGQVRREVAEEARRLRTSRGITPGLAVVRVGEDPGSKIYVTAERKPGRCTRAGAELESRSLGARHPGATTAAGSADVRRDHFRRVTRKRCRRVSPDQRWKSFLGPAWNAAVHSNGNHAATGGSALRDRGKTGGGGGPQQYRRKTHCDATARRQCDGHDLPPKEPTRARSRSRGYRRGRGGRSRADQ